MIIKKTNLLKINIITIILSFSDISDLAAQNCVTLPTCESLGYIDTADKCNADTMIKCPFDTSKVFCRKLLAPTTKICDTIGDVLFDNKTCAVDITNLDPKRTPIGVVFDVSKKLAVALDYAHHDWTQNGSSFATSDIPELPNYTGDNLINDYNGKSNTSIIIAYGDSNGYETAAADYCYNYSTLGTKKGDWYLPATGEVQLIYNNHAIINSTLSKIGAVIISYDYYWTSTEYDQKNAWRLDFSDGGFDEYPKYYSNKVRPILAF